MENKELFDLSYLFAQHIKGELTYDEQFRLNSWLSESQSNRARFDRMVNETKLAADFSTYGNNDKGAAWKMIVAETGYSKAKKLKKGILKIAVAASIAFCLCISGYLLFKPKLATEQIVKTQQDLKPGMNGAILTLANGQKVVLEQTKVGSITAGIQKSNDSLLVYNNAEDNGYNILETPKGRQYAVVLPDGSKVWLNAASSLKYPTRFAGTERLVELTGEGYFEVVHDGKTPFRVKTTKQLIEDIGTQFNVNAYTDEQVTATTLVEGAAKVNSEFLKPGFAALSKTPNYTIVKQVDIEEVTAWKNGAFFFYKTDIKTMMRQIGRWYNVEIAYEGPAPTKTITGKIHRNVNALQTLQILTYLNIHYRIEGKKIIITN